MTFANSINIYPQSKEFGWGGNTFDTTESGTDYGNKSLKQLDINKSVKIDGKSLSKPVAQR